MLYIVPLCMLLLLLTNVLAIVISDNVTQPEGKLGYEDLIEATITVLRCLPRDAERIVLLAGQYDRFLERAFLDVIPVALIAESNPRLNALEKFTLTRYSFADYQSYRFVQFLRPARRFVLIASSQPLLRSILQRTKDSPWANPDGFYILVDQRTESRGCVNARTYLWTAWDCDLLSVVFLCIDPHDGIVYYMFNPFSSNAPANWHVVGRAKGRNGHPWLLFKRKYVKGMERERELCKDMNFDKTANLNQYHIRLNAVEMQPYVHIDSSKSGLDRYVGGGSEILKIIFQKLNSVPEIYVLGNVSNYEIGGIGINGTFGGMLGALSDGKIDMSMNPVPVFTYWKLRYTYPHMKTGLCAISQTYELSMFTRIKTFMSQEMIMGILAVCVIVFVVFGVREGYGKSALQVVRIVIGVGILHPPTVNSARIFVCTVLILFLNVNAIFQSHWSSLLTLPAFFSNTDSADSIRDAGYTLYGPESLHVFIIDPVLKTRFHGVTYDECKEFVKNSSDAVCIEDCIHMHYRVVNESLHKSKRLREVMQAYVTREDWPLYKRVDQVLRKMGEFGLVQKFRNDHLFKYKLEIEWRNTNESRYKPLSIIQLKFTFLLLVGGSACSVVVFMLELMSRRCNVGKKRDRKERRKKAKRGGTRSDRIRLRR